MKQNKDYMEANVGNWVCSLPFYFFLFHNFRIFFPISALYTKELQENFIISCVENKIVVYKNATEACLN